MWSYKYINYYLLKWATFIHFKLIKYTHLGHYFIITIGWISNSGVVTLQKKLFVSTVFEKRDYWQRQNQLKMYHLQYYVLRRNYWLWMFKGLFLISAVSRWCQFVRSGSRVNAPYCVHLKHNAFNTVNVRLLKQTYLRSDFTVTFIRIPNNGIELF